MPVTWVFEPILRAFIAESTDPEPLDGIFRALDEILELPEGQGRLRILVDHKHPPTAAMVGDGLTRLFRYVPRIQGSTIMLVLPGAGDFGIGRMASLILGNTIEIEVFNDMATAVTSLSMNETY